MRPNRFTSVLALLLCASSEANAHVINTGLGPVIDGSSHLILSPENCVPVLALGLLAGLRGAVSAKKALFVLPIAWLAGAWLSSPLQSAAAPPLSAISFLILGLLIASDCRLKIHITTSLAILTGFLHGWLEESSLKAEGISGLSVVGSAITSALLLLLASGFVISLKPPWTRIVIRVLGSWIAATGLLMLGWWLHSAKTDTTTRPESTQGILQESDTR